jgi:outer membrane lipoprotein-sorting protein
MKKQKVIFVLVGILVSSLFLLSGCTQQSEIKESIQTILQKANNIEDVYYEIVGTTSAEYGNLSYNSTYIMKIWQKMPYMKTETITEGVTQIMVIRPDGNYMYNNQTKNYTKIISTDNETRQKALQEQSNDLLESQTLKVLGSDTIDGNAVTIVEYSYNISGVIMSPKYWIWNEKGIPLKMETKSTFITVNITMTEEYKNFVFTEIPDSIFNVS